MSKARTQRISTWFGTFGPSVAFTPPQPIEGVPRRTSWQVLDFLPYMECPPWQQSTLPTLALPKNSTVPRRTVLLSDGTDSFMIVAASTITHGGSHNIITPPGPDVRLRFKYGTLLHGRR